MLAGAAQHYLQGRHTNWSPKIDHVLQEGQLGCAALGSSLWGPGTGLGRSGEDSWGGRWGRRDWHFIGGLKLFEMRTEQQFFCHI